MHELRLDDILEAISDPLIIMTGDARVTHLNNSARSRMPTLAVGAFPTWAVRRSSEAFRLFLSRCLGSGQPFPGVLDIGDNEGTTTFRCWGARLGNAAGASVLLHVIPDGHQQFVALNRVVNELQRELAHRSEINQKMVELLAERERILARLETDSADRLRAERERDEVLVRLYRVHQRDRLRLARDLHDHAGQQIVSLKLGIGNLRDCVTTEEGEALLNRLLRQIDDAGRELRRVAVELRPAALEEFGLPVALRALLEDWTGVSGVSVEFQVVGTSVPLPSEAEVTLFRLVQEALTNVSKHAPTAGAIMVILQYGHTHVSLTVEDDGPGFDATDVLSMAKHGERGFGLIGMSERLALVRGLIEIDSRPGGGTSLFARIPLVGTPHAD